MAEDASMKKKKVPVGKWFSIISVIACLIVSLVALTRPRAQEKIQLEYGGESSTESEKTDVVQLNTEFTDSAKDRESFLANSDCPEPGLPCLTKSMENNKVQYLIAGIGGTGEKDAGSEADNTEGAGLIQDMGKMIAMTYSPQASANYYVADLLDNMGVATHTYAQGYGYYSLSPYLEVWKVFRNTVYMLFSIVIIIISFMILFRQRIGNQAAVTAQQALPRIVIALVLVSFSYAIAGFCIDLMYWIMYAFAGLTNLDAAKKGELITGGFGSLAGIVLVGKMGTIFGSVNHIVQDLFKGVVGGILATMIGWITGAIATLVILICLVTCLFRLLFLLLKSYASVLLYIIFSPFLIMWHAIPGSKSFQSWLFKILANLSPFIITYFLLIILGIINHYTSSNFQTGFVPPYLLGGGGAGVTADSLGSIVTLGILLGMPELVKNIKDKIGGGPGLFEQTAGAAWQNFTHNRGARAVTGLMAGGAVAGLRRFANARDARIAGEAARQANDEQIGRKIAYREKKKRAADDKLANANADLARSQHINRSSATRAQYLNDSTTKYNNDLADANAGRLADLESRYGSDNWQLMLEQAGGDVFQAIRNEKDRRDKLADVGLQTKRVADAQALSQHHETRLNQLRAMRNASNDKAYENARRKRFEFLNQGDTPHFLKSGFFNGASAVGKEWFTGLETVKKFTAFDRRRQLIESLDSQYWAYAEWTRMTGQRPKSRQQWEKERMDMYNKFYGLHFGG